MIFRGSYEVTRKLKGKDLEVTNLALLNSATIDGTLSVASGNVVNVNHNVVTQVGSPVNDTDASTKKYVDDAVRHMYTGIAVPDEELGDNEDVYLRGTTGGKRRLTGIPGVTVTDISSDHSTIIASTDSGTGAYYTSVDNGISWQIGQAIGDANTQRHVVSVGPGKFLISRKQIGTGMTAPLWTHDSGRTWSHGNVVAQTPSNITTTVWDKDNANDTILLLPENGKPIYSLDAGVTWALSDAPTGNYVMGSMFSNVVVIATADGTTYRSTDAGVTFTAQGALPAVSLNYRVMAALDLNEFIAAGTGNDSDKMAFTTNAGQSWTLKEVSTTRLEVIDLSVNRITGVIVSAGTTGIVGVSSFNTPDHWTPGHIDDAAHINQDIDSHGGGFVGVSYGPVPVIAKTDHSITWNTVEPAGFNELYAKFGDEWVVLDVLQRNESDSLYLSARGGIVNGNVGLNNHKMTGVASPTNPQDAANKQYVDSTLATTSGVFIDADVGTSEVVVDTVSKDIETFKYQLSAKKGNHRYYSEINVIANGVDNPVSAEYAVMSIGGLDVDVSVGKLSNGDTVVSASASEAGCEVRMKRLIIDL